MKAGRLSPLHGFFLLAIVLNLAFWMHSRHVFSAWDNVPPAPGHASSSLSALGDTGVAYRMVGYMLQNFGNTGGRYESLKNYDYDRLKGWLFAAQALDGESNYVPFLAAYYYGAREDDPKALSNVISYLADEGQKPYPQKWRWLAHAVYLARYKENNLPKALELADRLAGLKNKDVAPWARQMPAFIQLQMGNKEAAYKIMTHMLATEAGKIHPNEINAMRDFICERTLDGAQAAKDPLCAKSR
jgi:hypothetical protein